MFTLKPLLCATLAISVGASPILSRNTTQYTFAEIPPSKDLVWYPCFTIFFCAVLDVPLDYTNRTLGRSYIPLIKYPATSAPYKGMVLSNPGGPGGSGVSFVQGTYPTALTILGSNYDFVSWDPRGIGNALPSALCTLSSDLTGAKRKLKPRAPSPIPELEKLYGPTLAPIFFQDRYAEAVEYGPECAASIGANTDAGPHMTTATVARDMISILDAFSSSSDGSRCSNDATLLNYWGVSYGTFIGETFANMFPHRVGRVVLDGVLDPDEWIIQSGLNQITHTDDAFATFFIYCNLAGPTLCPFYTGSTPRDIFVRFENIVGQLNATYAFEQGWANATTIELLLSGIKSLLFTEVYSPIDTFPIIGRVLPVVESLLPGITIPEIEALAKELGVNITTGLTPQGLWSTEVICSDIGKGKFGEPLSAFDGAIAEFERESWLAGEVHSAGLLVCVAWSVESDYRYTGPFGGETKNPILFVSNTLDPVTAIENGEKGARIYKGAELLTIEGTGHSSLATQNKCAWGKMNTFFQSGVLPGRDNYCALEAGPFNITISGPLEKRADFMMLKRGLEGLKKRNF